jgi:hypothetical protein
LACGAIFSTAGGIKGGLVGDYPVLSDKGKDFELIYLISQMIFSFEMGNLLFHRSFTFEYDF